MSEIKRLIKHLSTSCTSADVASRRGSRSLSTVISPADMRASFAAALDGGLAEIELGALIALCANIESQRNAETYSEILLGLSEAIRERVMPIASESNEYASVVIPNYGDANCGNAIPLIAIKLQRMGIRVLVHGALETVSGLANCGVFRELGVLPVTTRGQAERRLAEDGLALVPTSLISPGLAAMMAFKGRLGVSTPAHVLADMLMPVVSEPQQSLHILNIPSWLGALADAESVVMQTPALLSSSIDLAESKFGSLDSRPQLQYRSGVDAETYAETRESEGNASGWQTLFQAEMESCADTIAFTKLGQRMASHNRTAAPSDTRSLAAWVRQRLDGNVALPQPVVHQLACCLYGTGYAQDFNQAKAIAAVETGSLAA